MGIQFPIPSPSPSSPQSTPTHNLVSSSSMEGERGTQPGEGGARAPGVGGGPAPARIPQSPTHNPFSSSSMEVEGKGKGERGTLPRPLSLDGLVSDELWANLNDYRRRVLIEIMDRTGIDDKTRVVPNIKFPPEAHFAPAPPGCRFKAMIPSEGYWEFGREQQEERAARWEREKRERQEREEVKRLEREEIRRRAFEEAMERDALDKASQRRALEDTIRQSRRAAAAVYADDDGESKRPRLTTP